MNSNLKLGLYVVSVLGLLVFGGLFSRAWRTAEPQAARVEPLARAERAPSGETAAVATAVAPVSHAAGTQNVASGSAAGTQGAVASATPAEVAPAAVAEPTAEQEPVPDTTAGRVSGKRFADLIAYGLLAVLSVAGLGLLIAHDVSSMIAAKATRVLFQEDAQGVDATDYEEVENAHAKGDFLEAIRLLREYHKENPRAVHAQIRIAEIYEKDLNNPLAAALEYEEVLQHPLEADRKGWTAIHLVNLYNRLEKTDQAVGWLQRIVTELPQTPAAVKARDRLTALGFVVDDAPGDEAGGTSASSDDQEPPSEGGLPRGFRRK